MHTSHCSSAPCSCTCLFAELMHMSSQFTGIRARARHHKVRQLLVLRQPLLLVQAARGNKLRFALLIWVLTENISSLVLAMRRNRINCWMSDKYIRCSVCCSEPGIAQLVERRTVVDAAILRSVVQIRLSGVNKLFFIFYFKQNK